MFTRNLAVFGLILGIAFSMSGCGMIGGAIDKITNAVGVNETGTVIAARAQIRSSFAVVAADLLEVKRGMTMDILEEVIFEKVKWYRVRAHDEEQTEGWIEAQNVIVGSLLDKSKKLAAEAKDLQGQADGQLRASTNLRLEPEQKDENIILKLEKRGENNATFQIIAWKYVLKAQDASEVDNAKNVTNRPRTRNEEIEAAKEAGKPEEMDEKYDIWYKVRLAPEVSPAPAGWVFGRQVELILPNDIAIYQKQNNRLVTWQKLDGEADDDRTPSKDGIVKVAKPASWVILLRSNVVKAKDGLEEPDFDGLLVLGYDKYGQEHYTVYRNSSIEGKVPLRIEGSGDNKSFVLQVRNASGALEEKRFTVFKDAKGRLKVTPPADIPVDKKE